jgi:hypothetical protein
MIDLVKSKPRVDEMFDAPSGHVVVYEAKDKGLPILIGTMVSAALADAISNPSVVICEQWASRSQDEPFQSQVARYFKNLFASWDALAQVYLAVSLITCDI